MTDTQVGDHEIRKQDFSEFVVGWDGSAPARAALDWAMERAPGGELTLVHVLELGDSPTEFLVHDSSALAERARLDAEKDRISAAYPDIRVDTDMVQGEVSPELLRYSTPERVVVVGTTRRHGSEGRYRWSVGSRLAGSASGPVAIIPEPDAALRSGVVVGVDGTESSAAALDFAAEESRRTDQPLYVVHSWMEPPAWQDAYMPNYQFLLSLQEMHQEVLDQIVSEVTSRYPNLTVEPILKRALPHDALLQSSRTANLLVLGNHGLHGIRRLLLGSVSHAAILGLQSPTVIVPAQQHT